LLKIVLLVRKGW